MLPIEHERIGEVFAANAEALAREIEKMQAAYEKAEGAEKKKLALELVANKKQLNS